MKKITLSFLVGFILIIALYFSAHSVRHSYSRPENTPSREENAASTSPQKLTIHASGGDTTFSVEIADTDPERIQGLSDRRSLEDEHGLFFIFDRPGFWGIWMKDMLFAIDVLWIDQNLVITDIVENMTPDSYPHAYNPHAEVLYVLEVPRGFVAEQGIKVGDSIVPPSP